MPPQRSCRIRERFRRVDFGSYTRLTLPPIAVIDFETTGLSPSMGDRATEVAIVLMEDGKVVDRFQSLMNAGVRISAFIEAYTGISNEMIADAPTAEEVMAQASRFVGSAPMVAHNASFDRRFWSAELERLGCDSTPTNNRHAPFACTMLLSRRLYPEARSFRLGSLAAFHDLPSAGRAHRAMADAEVAAALLARIQRDLERRYGVFDCQHALLVEVGKTPKMKVPEAIRKYFEGLPKAAKALDCGSKPAMTDI
jgi:DNA polymerase III subunit epsilon